MKFTDEIFLLEKLREGDIHALEVIFNRYYSSLCKYLSLLFKNQVVVEHIAQDIFVYLWENRENLTINGSFEAYVYSAGKYKALNQIRDNKKHDSIQESMGNNSDVMESIEKGIEIKELHSIIESAISTLPARCQQIFRLSREEELSNKEIAGLLGITVNTVEGQMSIAYKKLRTLLRPVYFRLFLAIY